MIFGWRRDATYFSWMRWLEWWLNRLVCNGQGKRPCYPDVPEPKAGKVALPFKFARTTQLKVSAERQFVPPLAREDCNMAGSFEANATLYVVDARVAGRGQEHACVM